VVYAAIVYAHQKLHRGHVFAISTSYPYSNNSSSGELSSVSPGPALPSSPSKSPLPPRSPSPLLCSSGEADGASGDGTKLPRDDGVPVTFML